VKEKITAFIHTLSMYDYILFGSAVFLFFLFIILALLLRNRFALAISLVLLGFATLLLGPTLGYIALHHYLYKNEVELLSQKRLHFTQAVVVKGTLTNKSRFDFKECKVTATAYKVTSNQYKNYVYRLKPLKKMSILLEDIPKGQTRKFKILVEPFTYKKDYNISLGADCR